MMCLKKLCVIYSGEFVICFLLGGRVRLLRVEVDPGELEHSRILPWRSPLTTLLFTTPRASETPSISWDLGETLQKHCVVSTRADCSDMGLNQWKVFISCLVIMLGTQDLSVALSLSQGELLSTQKNMFWVDILQLTRTVSQKQITEGKKQG